ncbi:MAG TPA: hypothetical protein VE817_08605 [Candidatus Acidoferrum sp.]|nr:hypothetical protein [Candidatus Acidoferrum sp.]
MITIAQHGVKAGEVGTVPTDEPVDTAEVRTNGRPVDAIGASVWQRLGAVGVG